MIIYNLHVLNICIILVVPTRTSSPPASPSPHSPSSSPELSSTVGLSIIFSKLLSPHFTVISIVKLFSWWNTIKKKLYNSFHQFEKELMHNLHATSLDAQLHPTCRICWKIHANNSHVIWHNNMAFAITLLPNISHLPSTLNLVESPYHM